MMKVRLKYLFFFLSLLLLFLMLLSGRNAGISCDEVLHYDQSVSVYNYFASHGADKSALNTGFTYLKFYGQSYDNFVTILIKWFGIEDIYGFRHIMSSLAGWKQTLSDFSRPASPVALIWGKESGKCCSTLLSKP